jgi:hypothetical protein
VQVKGMLLIVGGGVKLGCGPIWAKQGQKYLYQCCLRMKPKITSCCVPHSSPVNLFMTENTYIPFSYVWASKGALLYEVFQHRRASSTL